MEDFVNDSSFTHLGMLNTMILNGRVIAYPSRIQEYFDYAIEVGKTTSQHKTLTFISSHQAGWLVHINEKFLKKREEELYKALLGRTKDSPEGYFHEQFAELLKSEGTEFGAYELSIMSWEVYLNVGKYQTFFDKLKAIF